MKARSKKCYIFAIHDLGPFTRGIRRYLFLTLQAQRIRWPGHRTLTIHKPFVTG